jgi:peroxiredoxin
MSKPPPLSETLDALRTTSTWKEFYDEFVDRLRRLEVGTHAPQVGDRFPDVVLPDHLGRHQTLDRLLRSGPLVLSFIRGGWCPYCASELGSWNSVLSDLENAGGNLAIVTAELRGRSRLLADVVGPSVHALCDVDHGVALQLGLAFHIGPKMLDAYRGYGVDLNDLYGGAAGLLSVPATFVVRPDRIIEYAFVEPDFRVRAEPEDVVRVVASLRR